MSKYILDLIQGFEAETPTLKNQHSRVSFVGFLPIQANANYQKATDKDPEMFWAQLLCNYTSKYQRIDEHGQVTDDNKTLKTLVISFSKKYLNDNRVSVSEFVDFFEKNFVATKFLVLPVTEEKQAFQQVNGTRVPIKNQTKVEIDPNFNLRKFIDEFKISNKK